jgi:hypothetical protein
LGTNPFDYISSQVIQEQLVVPSDCCDINLETIYIKRRIEHVQKLKTRGFMDSYSIVGAGMERWW